MSAVLERFLHSSLGFPGNGLDQWDEIAAASFASGRKLVGWSLQIIVIALSAMAVVWHYTVEFHVARNWEFYLFVLVTFLLVPATLLLLVVARSVPGDESFAPRDDERDTLVSHTELHFAPTGEQETYDPHQRLA